jgi:hypothetical protein
MFKDFSLQKKTSITILEMLEKRKAENLSPRDEMQK